MLLIGTVYRWEPVEIADTGVKIDVLIRSTEPSEIADMERALPAPHPGPAPAENDPSYSAWVEAFGAWYPAWKLGVAQLVIKNWRGVGGTDAEGNMQPVPVTPDNIAMLMRDDRVADGLFAAIKRVNARIADDIAAAGNA